MSSELIISHEVSSKPRVHLGQMRL